MYVNWIKQIMNFTEEICGIFEAAGYLYVSTCSNDGVPNMAIKGLADIDCENNYIYFLDLYNGITAHNLLGNPNISVSAVDFKNFIAYQIKGTAELIDSGDDFNKSSMNWELDKYSRYKERISHSISSFMKEDVSELNLPSPKYLVRVKVEEVLSMAPRNKVS